MVWMVDFLYPCTNCDELGNFFVSLSHVFIHVYRHISRYRGKTEMTNILWFLLASGKEIEGIGKNGHPLGLAT